MKYYVYIYFFFIIIIFTIINKFLKKVTVENYCKIPNIDQQGEKNDKKVYFNLIYILHLVISIGKIGLWR